MSAVGSTFKNMSDANDTSRSGKRAKKDFVETLRRALQNEDTRLVLRWVLDTGGLFDEAFTGNSQTFYREGRRSVSLELISALNEVDPYEFVRLLKESADDIVLKRNQARKGRVDAD